MHVALTMKTWSHHLHDGMLSLWHHIDEHFHSRHFWAGVVLTLLIAGVIALLFILAKEAPYIYPPDLPYVPSAA